MSITLLFSGIWIAGALGFLALEYAALRRVLDGAARPPVRHDLYTSFIQDPPVPNGAFTGNPGTSGPSIRYGESRA